MGSVVDARAYAACMGWAILIGVVVLLLVSAVAWDAIKLRRIGKTEHFEDGDMTRPQDQVFRAYGDTPPSDGGGGSDGGGSG